MTGNGVVGIVDTLLATAEGSDEEIIQTVNRVGIQPTLQVLFTELLLDIDVDVDVPKEVAWQYELALGPIVLTHEIVRDADGCVSVDAGGWRPGVRAEGYAEGRTMRFRHSLLEFVELFRATLGPAAAGTGHQVAGRCFDAASQDLAVDWPAEFARRAARWADMKALAVRFGADKWGVHWYTNIYHRYLSHLRDRRLRILEIGVGGYGDPYAGGGSLQMWRRYFPRSSVYGMDIADKSPLDAQRIRTVVADQGEEKVLTSFAEEHGPFDLIVDDGSHVCADQITSFETLFPYVSDNGFYIVEDLQTSYWPGFGGSTDDLGKPDTGVGRLKKLVDGLNYEEFFPAGTHVPTYTDRTVVAAHFFHSMAIVEKGRNAEGSAGAFLPDEIKRSGLPANQGDVRPDRW